MSYPAVDTVDAVGLAENLLYRKEFYSFAEDPVRDYRDPNDFDMMRDKYLKLRAHQLFVRNLMAPTTPYRGIVLKWKPGTGKTAGAIAIAQSYITVYQQVFNMRIMQLGPNRKNIAMTSAETPSVFVLGFTKLNIIKELLKYPEFGFVTIVERDELTRLRLLANNDAANAGHYKEYLQMLRRRITNKMRGGFYKFYGYQEFVNRLFISDGIDLTQLETIAMRDADTGAGYTRLEKTIADYIASGKIQINADLMKQFENSLLICDEIHDTYNQHMKNNYGVAIQYVLDSVASLRAVFLTATPLNNSPTEIVEILNYVCSGYASLTKRELFGTRSTVTDEVLQTIGKLSAGRFSFVQDINAKYYPTVTTDGQRRVLRKCIGEFKAIPYVTVHACVMPPMHMRTYAEFLKTTGQIGITDSSKVTVAVDSFAIVDMCFPNPSSDEIGLYRSGDIKSEIAGASNTWKQKTGVRVSSDHQISGAWLHRDNVGKYAGKFETLLSHIDASFERSRLRLKQLGDDSPYTAGEKILIYHERVRSTGVLLIAALLRENAIIDEFSEPVDGTLCATCGYAMSSHDASVSKAMLPTHMFYPCRFIVAHSEIDKGAMLNSLDKYNSTDNSYGSRYKFLIGSKIIRQSYDIKDTEFMIVLALPVNISGLIQLRGRVERHGSHHGLPQSRRKVVFSYYISVFPDDLSEYAGVIGDPVTIEEYRYVEKFSNYMQIQLIEQVINANAIDGPLVHSGDHMRMNRDGVSGDDRGGVTVESLRRQIGHASMRDRSIAEGRPVTHNTHGKVLTKHSLAPLGFDPVIKIRNDVSVEKLNMSTWWGRNYGLEEIATINMIIKRLFMIAPAYTYDELWRQVREPPFGVEVNPKLFDERNFAVALDMLVKFDESYIDSALDDEIGQRNVNTAERMIIRMLFDASSRYIYVNYCKHKIECIGDMFVRFAVSSDSDIVGKETVVRDVESFMRPQTLSTSLRINLDRWLEENKNEYNYAVERKMFIEKFGSDDSPDISNTIGAYTVTFYQHLFADIISVAITGKDTTGDEPDLQTRELFKSMLRCYDDFGAIIYIRDIVRYKDTAKKFVSADGTIITQDSTGKYVSKDLPTSTPIGFIDIDCVRAFDGNRWLKINKAALNIRTQFVENKVIVGYFDLLAHGTEPKFKIRRSARKAPTGDTSRQVDIRTFERGIVCGTKSKAQLIEIIRDLGLVTPTGIIKGTKTNLTDVKITTLCGVIRQRLIDLEIASRRNDSNIKYLYMWFEEM